MPYNVPKPELDALGTALASYYEEAWQEGVKGLFDKMARSQMGVVTGYLDQAKDTFANLRKTSNDKFGITFKPALKQQVMVVFAGKNDIASVMVTIAEKALSALASHIPVPVLGTVVSQVVSFAADKGRAELHTRSVNEADKQLAAKTGTATGKFFTNDVEAQAGVQQSIDQYKLICKFIQTLPANISSFDDAVTFPGAVFKVQAAASSLNVALVEVREYLAGMQERLTQIQGVSKDYIVRVRRDMPDAANAVLQAGYSDAYQKGEADVRSNKYSAPANPGGVKLTPDKKGGATMLAAYLANAVAQGYYDAGNRGPMQMGRPRAGAVTTPPSPFPAPPSRRV